MRQSQLFAKTKKEALKDEKSINAQFLIRAGFVYKEMAGVYTFLPLGLRVLRKIENIIRDEMNRAGGQELYPTTLQDKASWEKTNRWDNKIVDNWFKTKLKNNIELGLAFTHEEPLTALMAKHLSSYKDLPVYLYEICAIFRNEMRAKSGILRGREYYWKALYSFSKDEQEHSKFYEKMKDVYENIFKQVGLKDKTYLTFASGGSFSKYSHEFQTLCQAGEDIIYLDKEKNIAINKNIYTDKIIKELGLRKEKLIKEKAIEIGNIFSLGYKFSEPLGLKYRDKNGQEKFVYMGSYGIGLTRLMGTIVEIHHDDKGIIWPKSVAPFDIHLILLGKDKREKQMAERLYQDLQEMGFEVLYDDREDKTPGEKFADCDLMGIPWRLVVSEKTMKKNNLELKRRSESEVGLMEIKKALDFLKKEAIALCEPS
jgi:prolyl-tRNA synthetase